MFNVELDWSPGDDMKGEGTLIDEYRVVDEDTMVDDTTAEEDTIVDEVAAIEEEVDKGAVEPRELEIGEELVVDCAELEWLSEDEATGDDALDKEVVVCEDIDKLASEVDTVDCAKEEDAADDDAAADEDSTFEDTTVEEVATTREEVDDCDMDSEVLEYPEELGVDCTELE
ncbi:hypothetical protein CC86DRAFT_413635 [Ophiobolus disseminans]|uniref:Uncharacterized protein n=1 Tax=Ophiobolus disseminans TaxID=1469910 RepID=A0A6A6ZD12_9PLEO|nr:hypothetical protein CC86DRAFT_413635 [Ophiobolus disseminans]